MSSFAGHLVEALVWINEIESAKSVAELKTSKPIAARFLILMLHAASRASSRLEKRRVFIEEDVHKQRKRFLMGRQVARMMCEYFNVNDTVRF